MAARRPVRGSRGAGGADGARGQRSPRQRSKPAGGAQRFAARSRRRIWRRLRVAVVMLAVVGVIGGVAWSIGWSGVTALDEVRVDGASGELSDSVMAAADAPLGTPLIRVDVAAMEASVRDLPELADVSVARSWPRSVVITVTPRTPAAAVTDGSSWWLVDHDGVLFGEAANRPDDVPVLDTPTEPEAVAARSAGVAVLTGLPRQLRKIVTAVSAESEASIELTLEDGATVVWGTPDEMARKADVLLALLDEDASTYDVSAPMNPAIRP